MAPKLPQNMSSNVPWRKAGVKYTQNEIYFDIVEEIDATIAAYVFDIYANIQKKKD